jgi:hypothetical protein
VPDSFRLPEAQTESVISRDKDSSVENGEKAKPNQESLSAPSPKCVDSDSGRTEGRYHCADNQEGDRAAQNVTPLEIVDCSKQSWVIACIPLCRSKNEMNEG